MTGPRLAHALIYAHDLAALAAFYTRALALEAEPTEHAGYQVLRGPGGPVLALHALPPHVAASMVITSPPARREDTAIKPCFEVEGLETARAQIQAAGGAVDAAWTWGGLHACDAVDLEGNVFQVFVRETELGSRGEGA